MLGKNIKADPELMLMIEPPPCLRMIGIASFIAITGPTKSKSNK